MPLLGSVRNMYSTISKVSEQAGSLLGIADERGLTGVMRNLMGLDPEGMSHIIDETVGVGLIDMLRSGDKAGVDTALAFRDYLQQIVLEFANLRDLLTKFNSDEPGEKEQALAEMRAIIASQKRTPGGSHRVRTLEAELEGAHAALDEIAALAARSQGKTLTDQ